jgi:origin recognition complex subunit 6
VFTAVAFYLSAKKHKLKVDKMKLMEICGTSDTEFGNVATSMLDLCFDILGVEKEKRDPKSIQQNRELLDVIPGKRRHDTVTSDSDSESVDDEDGLEVSVFP